jgi:hypothetical protein
MIKWMQQRGYSWSAWDFGPEGAPVYRLISNWRTMTPTAYFGVPVKRALAAQAVKQSPAHGPAPHR